MKNPFWKIESVLKLLLIPFSLFLIIVSISLMLFNEKDGYIISLFLIPLGITLCAYSVKYAMKINKSFKNDLIAYLNDLAIPCFLIECKTELILI